MKSTLSANTTSVLHLPRQRPPRRTSPAGLLDSTGIIYTLGFSGMWFAGIWNLVDIVACIWLGVVKTRIFPKRLGTATLPKKIGRKFESKGPQLYCSHFDALFPLPLFNGSVEGRRHCLVRHDTPKSHLRHRRFVAWPLGYHLCEGFWEITTKLAAQNPKLMILTRPELPKFGVPTAHVELVGIPIMLDCLSNGFVARILYWPGFLKIEPWKGYLAAMGLGTVFFATAIYLLLATSNGHSVQTQPLSRELYARSDCGLQSLPCLLEMSI